MIDREDQQWLDIFAAVNRIAEENEPASEEKEFLIDAFIRDNESLIGEALTYQGINKNRSERALSELYSIFRSSPEDFPGISFKHDIMPVIIGMLRNDIPDGFVMPKIKVSDRPEPFSPTEIFKEVMPSDRVVLSVAEQNNELLAESLSQEDKDAAEASVDAAQRATREKERAAKKEKGFSDAQAEIDSLMAKHQAGESIDNKRLEELLASRPAKSRLWKKF